MKIRSLFLSLLSLVLFLPSPIFAHFGMVIPSTNSVDQSNNSLRLEISFSHPMELEGMNMEKPKRFGVFKAGKIFDLTNSLKESRILNHKAWISKYTVKRPGIYQFFVEPVPYWEPAEDSFIIHYTKTIVGAFGYEEGWDRTIGLKTEIMPLTRPFGLYAGNTFRGVVLLNGKPVPFSDIEIEYYNRDRKITPPTPYHITQTIKADKNGVFTYTVPWPGWWGFAALNSSPTRLKYKGTPKDVELGAVIWVYFNPWK